MQNIILRIRFFSQGICTNTAYYTFTTFLEIPYLFSPYLTFTSNNTFTFLLSVYLGIYLSVSIYVSISAFICHGFPCVLFGIHCCGSGFKNIHRFFSYSDQQQFYSWSSSRKLKFFDFCPSYFLTIT